MRNRELDGAKFCRQEIMGEYIVDFTCLERKLVIEIDGGQHNSDNFKEADGQRETWLKGQGFQVIRFWNTEVLQNIEGVLTRITECLGNTATLT